MPAGRPRTVTPPPEEMIKLGEEMIEFVSAKKNNVLHLNEWWSTEKFFLESVWDTMCRAQEFFPYYERALKIIGKKYLDKNSNVRDGISQRWQRTYFKDLKRLEDQDLNEAAARTKSTENTKESPFQNTLDLAHENMRLKAEIAKLSSLINEPKASTNDNQSETG